MNSPVPQRVGRLRHQLIYPCHTKAILERRNWVSEPRGTIQGMQIPSVASRRQRGSGDSGGLGCTFEGLVSRQPFKSPSFQTVILACNFPTNQDVICKQACRPWNIGPWECQSQNCRAACWVHGYHHAVVRQGIFPIHICPYAAGNCVPSRQSFWLLLKRRN